MKIGDTVIVKDGDKIIIGTVRDTYNHGKAIKLEGISNRDFDIADCIPVSNE